MNNDNEKNISLILKSEDEKEDSHIIISFSTIFSQIKRIISLWIVISIIVGLVSFAGIHLFNNSVKSDTVTSLISFNYSGISAGLAPDGNTLNINKIKSPSIIEKALTNLGEPLEYVESIRRNITIEGMVPNSTVDKMSLYYEVYTKGGSSSLEAVNELLSIGYYPTYYTVSFDNNEAELELEQSKKIVNEILNVYQEYFFKTYGYNEALGNSIVAIDYKEYDYPAAVDIFHGVLSDLDVYVRRLQNNSGNSFRSNETGYSFSDIRRSISILNETDLDALSAYITVNNVTNDKETLLTYYNYKIEELEREKEVLQTELNSITNSINSYEKDTMLIFGDVNNVDGQEYSQVSEKYDQMIEEKIAIQERLSTKKQSISYYTSRLETFKNSNGKNTADIDFVEKEFEELYEKIKNLIDIATKTSDEYYEDVVFANAFNILVPAAGNLKEVQLGNPILLVLIVEVVLFIGFLGFAVISAIVIDNKKNKEEFIDNN